MSLNTTVENEQVSEDEQFVNSKPRRPATEVDSIDAEDVRRFVKKRAESSRAINTRMLDETTILDVSKLVSKGLTESESCRQLEIEPTKWFNFKLREGNDVRFKDSLEACRAARIRGLLERIEKSAEGIDLKYPDWRAAAGLLKFADRKRFGDDPSAGSVSVSVNAPLEMLMQAVDKAYRLTDSKPASNKAAIDVEVVAEQPKSIDDDDLDSPVAGKLSKSLGVT